MKLSFSCCKSSSWDSRRLSTSVDAVRAAEMFSQDCSLGRVERRCSDAKSNIIVAVQAKTSEEEDKLFVRSVFHQMFR